MNIYPIEPIPGFYKHASELDRCCYQLRKMLDVNGHDETDCDRLWEAIKKIALEGERSIFSVLDNASMHASYGRSPSVIIEQLWSEHTVRIQLQKF